MPKHTTFPAMIGVYQGILIGSLSLLRIADVTSLTAYSILVFTIQLTFWLVMGVWSIFRMDLKLNELIDRARIILDKSSQNDTSVS